MCKAIHLIIGALPKVEKIGGTGGKVILLKIMKGDVARDVIS